MNKQKFLKAGIKDEKEAIDFYGKKPKGVDGKVAGIIKDEKRHKKILTNASHHLKGMRHVEHE
jgi:rubrerythrin